MTTAAAVPDQLAEPGALRRAVIASGVGSILEWYDFTIYGSAAAVVFAPLFFPKQDPLIGTLASFATFGVGFLARPFGGVLFGNMGDVLGRKTVLLITVMLMGIATICIGLLPTYSTIGLLAAALLVLLRVLQGLGSGAEQGGAVVLVTEFAPRSRRGFYVNLGFVGILLGTLLGNGVFALFLLLPKEQFLSWGWRIPFLLSIVVVGIGIWMRLRLSETPVFEEVEKAKAVSKFPLGELLRKHPREILIGIGCRMGENGSSYLFQVFVLSYVVLLGVKSTVGLVGVLIASAVAMVTLPLFGALSDRVGRRPVFIGGTLFTILFAFPYFWLLGTKSTILIWIAIVLSLVLGTWTMLAAELPFLSELFDAKYRYSGVALSREISAPIAGGVAPFVASALLAVFSRNPAPVAIYLIALCLITLVSMILAPETRWKDVREEELHPPAVAVPAPAATSS
jgi:MFS transporter, MHS family, shikimate and dehydroshikimate transport protein